MCTILLVGRSCPTVGRGGDLIPVTIEGPGLLGDAHLDCAFAGAQCGGLIVLACSDTSERPADFCDIEPCFANGVFFRVVCETLR